MKNVASRSTSSESVNVMSQPYEILGRQLPAGVHVVAHHLYALGIDIEADNLDFAGEFEGDRQAHVAEADNGQLGLFLK